MAWENHAKLTSVTYSIDTALFFANQGQHLRQSYRSGLNDFRHRFAYEINVDEPQFSMRSG